MSAVEELREAARLMRERARAATPGPWQVGGADETYVDRAEVGWAPYWVAAMRQANGRPDAVHVASWHPAVALAVADWLDATAEKAAEWNHVVPLEHPEALAVARAYLGVEVPA